MPLAACRHLSGATSVLRSARTPDTTHHPASADASFFCGFACTVRITGLRCQSSLGGCQIVQISRGASLVQEGIKEDRQPT